LDIQAIRSLVQEGMYELTKHAERERELDMIFMLELEDALRYCEIIENYSDDPRGASCLVLGFCDLKPIHAVCTIRSDPEELLLITVYDPSKRPDKWTDNYRKRR
jgi:proteasome assembly chaperone (PAC2) family protein